MPIDRLERTFLMDFATTRARMTAACCGLIALAYCSLGAANADPSAPSSYSRLSGQVLKLSSQVKDLGEASPTETVDLAVSLSLRNKPALDEFIQRIYNPADPLYGQYLTVAAFIEGYAPTQADYDLVKSYLTTQGLTVKHDAVNRLIIDASGPSAAVEKAFGVTLEKYQAADGRIFHAITSDPVIPAQIASNICAVAGLNTNALIKPLYHESNIVRDAALPNPAGSGPLGGYGPTDIKNAYNLTSLPNTALNAPTAGAGQVLAVAEFGTGYSAANITTYTSTSPVGTTPGGFATYFNAYEASGAVNYVPPVSAVSVDSFSTTIMGPGEDEAELDIELALAMAPQLSQLLVFEAPNSAQGFIDMFNAVATDTTDTGTNGVANIFSMSWGVAENEQTTKDLLAENQVFEEMASQGQSAFIATGDNGAFTDFTVDYPKGTPVADDPATQPLVTAVGGTSLVMAGVAPSLTYGSESPWNDGVSGGKLNGGASGGGISAYWTIPTYQAEYIPASSEGSSSVAKASNTMRNTPDVALSADYTWGSATVDPAQNPGYAVYVAGKWATVGGTSGATPLWAGFAALVNQTRLANNASGPTLGFANPALYELASSVRYASDFNDIYNPNPSTTNPNITNLYYSEAQGYDLTTGWGSMNGGNLLSDLTPATQSFSSGLNFFSVPYTYNGIPLGTLLGYSSPYVLVYDPNVSNWYQPAVLQAGVSYWARFPQSVAITALGIPGTATTSLTGMSATPYFTITIKQGWNQIGDPFTSPVTLTNCYVVVDGADYTWQTATTTNTSGVIYVDPTLFFYSQTSPYQYLTTTSSLEPNTGYWIYAYQTSTLYIPNPGS